MAPFHRTGADTWATYDAGAAFGSWKTIVRLHDGRNLEGRPFTSRPTRPSRRPA